METNESMQADSGKSCHLSWHVTARCNLSCRHCLRRAPGQPTGELDRAQLLAILDSFVHFAGDNHRDASIEFSGGDPLVREDFLDLLAATSEARRAGPLRHVRILGNPEHLDDATARTLAALGVDEFFVSLDGLEEENDRIRGRGNFAAAVRGIRALVKAGIRASVKATIFRPNAHQAVDLLALAIGEGVGEIVFGPLILAGSGYRLRAEALSPAEYRGVLFGILAHLDSLGASHAALRRAILTRDRTYALLFFELGRIDEYRALCADAAATGEGPRARGGHVMFVVWSDGEVVLRREMQRQGWVPRDSFQRIYDHSYALQLLEDRGHMERAARDAQRDHVTCRTCPVADCCPPVMVGTFGARVLFEPNRHCWKLASPGDAAPLSPVANGGEPT